MTHETDLFLVDGKHLTGDECRSLFAGAKLDSHHRQALALIEGAIVVDVGCYAGLFVAEAARLYPDKSVIGIDYFPDNIRLARMLNPDLRERFRQMSAYSLDLAENSVDCVTLLDVIEHLEGAAVAVKEINRVLKIGGSLIVSTPNPFYWRQMLLFSLFEIRNMYYRWRNRPTRMATQIYFENVEWNRHIYSWTPDTLMTLLAVNGFGYATHSYAAGSGALERLFLRVFPFLGGTQVLKVMKLRPAPPTLV